MLTMSLACPASDPGHLLPTVAGPETPALLVRAGGTCAWVDSHVAPWTRVQVLDVASGRVGVFEVEAPVRAIAGPDRAGRIVTVESRAGRTMDYALRSHELSTGSDAHFEFHGQLLMNQDAALSLSPVRHRAALVVQLHLGAYRYAAPRLSVVELDTGDETVLDEIVAMARPHFFPDGRRVVFTDAVGPDGAPWTTVVDLETNERRALCTGVVQAASPDGRSLLVDEDGRLRRVDATSGAVLEVVDVPGAHRPAGDERGRFVVDLGQGLYLHDALPTTGAETESVTGFMAKGGPTWPIKVTDVSTREFATSIAHVWHWTPISYGVMDRAR